MTMTFDEAVVSTADLLELRAELEELKGGIGKLATAEDYNDLALRFNRLLESNDPEVYAELVRDVKSLNEQVGELSQTVKSHSDHIDELLKGQTSIARQVGEHTDQIVGLNERVGEHADQIEELNERVDAVEKEVTETSNDLLYSLAVGLVFAMMALLANFGKTMPFGDKVGWMVLWGTFGFLLAFGGHHLYYWFRDRKKKDGSTPTETEADEPAVKKPGLLRRTINAFPRRTAQSTSEPTPVRSTEGPDNQSGSSGTSDDRTQS